MTSRIFMVAAVVLSALSAASAETKMPVGDVRMVMTRTIEDVIRPGYAAFHEQTGNLTDAVGKLCAGPAAQTLKRSRTAFRQTVLTWAGIENVQFGPVMAENRLERILFWPDRKSIGLRQVQAALAKQDESVTDLAALQSKSVAMQGLNALEFVLFGTGSDKLAFEAGFRCDYAKTIAANLDQIGGELEAQWVNPNGISAYWTADREAKGIAQSLNQLVGTMVHGLESVRDTRLRTFVGLDGKRDRPKSALFWRSNMTLPMLRTDIEGLSRFFEESAMELLLPVDQKSIADSIKFELHEAIGLLPPDERPVDKVLADKAARDRIVLLDTILASLIDRFDKQYAGATGLSAGFSFADGD